MSCARGNSPARVASYRPMQGRGRRHSAAVHQAAPSARSASGRQKDIAVAERQPAAAELVDALHPGKVTSGLFDHCDVVDGLKHPHRQFGLISTPLVGGPLHIMIGISIPSPMLRKS